MIEGNEVVARRGVIATGPAEAARVGGRIFERGGNAMDAAAGACLACAVLEPQAVDIGGYVAAGVVREGKTGQMWSLDANAFAPAASHDGMYEVSPPMPGRRGINEIEYTCSVRDDANVYGALSVAVPGFVGGVGTLWERWGCLQWAEVVEPSRELIDSGLCYGLVRRAVEAKRDVIAAFPSTAEILLPRGRIPDADQQWSRTDLASTLERLAAAGWRDFYDGEIGRTIADFVTSQGGILTRDDMATFAPRVTKPCSDTYRDSVVHTAVAPNGGFSVLEALRDLEAGGDPLPDTDPGYWERFAEVLQSMWRRRLGMVRAGTSPHGTVHVAAADQHGNLVSMTISQGGLFGSCLAVPGTGIILGHGMCRFDPHAGHANSPGPRKRPLNNVCPLIIHMPDRDVAIGARGGRRIVSVCAQLAQRIVDFGSTVYEAASAPRIHLLTGEPLEISHNFDHAIRDALAVRGHRIEVPDEVAGTVHGAEILQQDGVLRAGGNTWAVGV
jgi:gamma-glutamyltranspeptidase/glutathione hydrolase